jgi:2',3'-cyclic-nucleotide 2'-phosphodiesterase (5'-nucleotidase family)
MKPYLALILIFSFACSFKKSQLENQTQSGHNELYSSPEAPKKVPEGYKRVVVVATNDVQGQYAANEIKFNDKHNGNQTVQIGGVDIISAYYQVLRQQYENLLLVDSGDLFSEKFQDMKFTQNFYDVLKYDAFTIGTGDFNMKLPARYKMGTEFFKDFSKGSKTPLVLSNLYELKTGRLVEWDKTEHYLMKEINGIKVGIIGLVPDDLVDQTPVDNRVGLYVESMLQSTLRHARLLRSIGAELIVVLTHQGLNCGEEIAQELKLPLNKVNFEPTKNGACDVSNKLGQYLSRLPPHLVDVVIGGRNHQKTANYVNSTLVLSSFDKGMSFSYAEFFFHQQTKKLNRDLTIVHQPVMFCREFFKETNDCYYEDPSVDHKVRSEAMFLGLPIKPDITLEKKFESFLKNPTTSLNLKNKEIQAIVNAHQADLSYLSQSSGHSQLVLLSLSGKELGQLLEQEYNMGSKSNWNPSPFLIKDQSLVLSLQGNPIVGNQSYKILAALDDIQKHPSLKRLIGRVGHQSLMNVSWNEPMTEKDDVSTAMAASDTVR